MRDTFIATLLVEARKDPNIILITGDLGYGVLDIFQQELPGQFINSGVNEQTMMGMAAGYASTGKRVFVYSIGNFPTLRCLEQIRNDVCLMNNSVVIVSVGAGYAYGSQGYTHHALEDIAVMRALPNLDIVVPADPIETSAITKYLSSTKSPTYLRLGKSKESNFHKNQIVIKPGKMIEVLEGKDGTIVFSGSVGVLAINAQQKLLEKGISVSVTSMPFVTPIDIDYLRIAAGRGPIVVVEEHSYRGGVGSAVLEALTINSISARISMVASDQNNLSQIGDQDFLRSQNGITVEEIIAKFCALMEV